MYDDEPQDRVHDVLADAVFGSHPLGRRVLGEADVIANIPIPDIEAYRSDRYAGSEIVVGAAGHLEHDAIVALAEKLVNPPTEGGGVAPRDGAHRAAAALLPEQGDRAVPHLLRRAGHRPRGRAALPARRPRLDLRRLDLLAALPRGAREARPGLLGRLLQRAVHRHRPGRHLRRHPRGQRRGGLRDHRHRARPAALRAGLGGGAPPRQGERQGEARPLLRVDRRADDPDLPLGPVRAADRKPRRDARQSRRGRGRPADRAGGRALRRGPASRRPASAPTKTASGRRSRRSRRPWSQHDQGRRLRRRRADGRDGLSRRSKGRTT